ncbi:MAG: DNA polymerase III subunit beta [Oscillospiraceae bacterium]|jgi:DNA polymerase-3 subunit beta|nr:DNA polymerase III subunit beta [Oscillospiraceae bacterium]
MKFVCNSAELTEVLTRASRFVPTGNTQEILKGLLLKTAGDTLTVTANNLESAIVCDMETHVVKDGACVVEARLLFEIVKRFRDEDITITADDNNKVAIKGSRADFELISMSADKYPDVPNVEGLRSFTMTQPVLKGMLERTVFCASTNESKVVHTGVLFDCEPDDITLVALDGYRMALTKQKTKIEDTFSFVVPAQPLSLLEKILASEGEHKVALSVGSKFALFIMPGVTFYSRLLEGEFMKYKTAVPAEQAFSVVLNTKEFTESIEHVAAVFDERIKNPIRLVFGENGLTISCHGSKKGELRIDMACGELEIGFNHKYLLEALRHVPHQNVLLKASTPTAAFVFEPAETGDYLFMVLPVRLLPQ